MVDEVVAIFIIITICSGGSKHIDGWVLSRGVPLHDGFIHLVVTHHLHPPINVDSGGLGPEVLAHKNSTLSLVVQLLPLLVRHVHEAPAPEDPQSSHVGPVPVEQLPRCLGVPCSWGHIPEEASVDGCQCPEGWWQMGCSHHAAGLLHDGAVGPLSQPIGFRAVGCGGFRYDATLLEWLHQLMCDELPTTVRPDVDDAMGATSGCLHDAQQPEHLLGSMVLVPDGHQPREACGFINGDEVVLGATDALHLHRPTQIHVHPVKGG
jgi:hypothetical protein